MDSLPDGTQGQATGATTTAAGAWLGSRNTRARAPTTTGMMLTANCSRPRATGRTRITIIPYTFAGKEWDEHLGLYEFGVRLYDPWAGVWLTREPLPGEAREPRTWHRYQYAYASPISYYDPYGLQVEPPECKPGEICYTGTLPPYNVQLSPSSITGIFQPLSLAPEGPRWAAGSHTWVDLCAPSTSVLRDLLRSVRPGGRYGYGELLVRGQWWSIYVPPMRFGRDYYNPDLAFYYNTPYDETGWQTVQRIQGVTRFPQNVVQLLTEGLALGWMQPGYGFGPPASLDVYFSLQINEGGYAWLSERASPAPLEIDLPAENFYDALAGAIQMSAGFAEAWNIGNRAYQVVLQVSTTSSSEERALIQTFYIYQDRAGFQISPRYLYLTPEGQPVETSIIYPYASVVLRGPGLCAGSSACWNTAMPFLSPFVSR